MIYLLIEFIDELVFGVAETARPLFRDDLHLTYTQIGLLLSLPGMIAAFIEPFIGILGDVWKRRLLIIAGGILFTFSLFMTSSSYSFLILLTSFLLFSPSSGAFVSLSRANLMDSDTARHEQNMARWTFAGSLGVLSGPLLLGLFIYFGLGWRGTYAVIASFPTLCLFAVLRYLPPDPVSTSSFPSLHLVFDGFALRSHLSNAWKCSVGCCSNLQIDTDWYPILQGRLYSSLPGQSASLRAIVSITAPLANFFPFLIGFLADRIGLQTAMWIFLLGPIALLIGLPRRSQNRIP